MVSQQGLPLIWGVTKMGGYLPLSHHIPLQWEKSEEWDLHDNPTPA